MQDSLTHADSRKNLLGKNPSKELIDEFSNEMQVNGNTPPHILPMPEMIKLSVSITASLIMKH